MSCPICKSNSLTVFLERENVPVHQNLVFKDKKSAAEINRGNLRFALCKNCGFVFNRDFDSKKLNYGPGYDNTQTHSPKFKEHTQKLIRHLISEKNIRNCTLVEVGCGNGQFLEELIKFEGANNTGYGFDPSYTGPSSFFEGRLNYEKKLYGPGCSHIQADVVICRHVIEHVADPLELLKNIRSALQNSPNARVFFETPCVKWILKNKVIWDFFYEHCSLFSEESLTAAFELAGFNVISIKHVFEGQYLWLEAAITNKRSVPKKHNFNEMEKIIEAYSSSEKALFDAWKSRLESLNLKGKIAVWGAGAKGVTFVNLLDPTHELIDCLIDINPNKFNAFVPGSGHLITGYKELKKRNISAAILMNPNYRDENLKLLRSENISVQLVD